MERGLFIVFEGLDGSGTGTQIDLLANFFKARGYTVHKEEEPSEFRLPFGKKADDVLKKNIPHPGARELQVWMVKDRVEHVRQIEKWLSEGCIVLCSRYFYSTLVYGEASGVSYEELWVMNKYFLRPDLAIYQDISAEEAMRRVQQRRESTGSPMEIFEKLRFQESVRKLFLYMIGKPEFPELHMVNGELSAEEVYKQVLLLVDQVPKVV